MYYRYIGSKFNIAIDIEVDIDIGIDIDIHMASNMSIFKHESSKVDA